ncbi:MAG: EAL domain-containing protein [Sideroxydans sp.]|jgi:diguanylate cyclase (GGDEF)-like protein/PAS domain S-box-containing protein
MLSRSVSDKRSSRRFFVEPSAPLKYKNDFLKIAIGLVFVASSIMAVYYLSISIPNSVANLMVAIASAGLFFHLGRHPEQVEIIGTLTLGFWFLATFLIYLFITYNSMRLVLFFPLTAAAFYLKGLRFGIASLLVYVGAILIGPWLLGVDVGYTNFELLFTCFYLVIMFAVLWNYEVLKADQFQREHEYEMQRIVDERWRVAMEGAGDAIWDWDLQTNRFNYSRSYAEMLGYSEDEFGDKPDHLATILHPDEKQQAMDYLYGYLNGDFSGQYFSEHRLQCKDGSYKWILCRGRVTQRDATGRPKRMVGTHTDITERKHIETNLHESEKRLRMAFEASRMGAWSYEFDSHKLHWSPEIFRIFGLEPYEPSAEDLMQHIHPDDRERVVSARDRAVIHKIPYLVEYRVEKGQAMRWIESRAEVQYDAEGKPLNMIGTVQDITERKEHEKQLQHIAHFDALTGVPNRVLLADRLSQSLARAKRDHGLMAVCYLDLDGFKPVNDNYGHDVGDKVLVEITRRIKEAIREDDTVARLGGDEFVVLLVGMQAPEECAGSLNRLLDVIHQPIEIQGQSIRISASIGVALYPEDDHDPDTLLRHADQAMYVAKQSGKNRYHLFDPANDERTRTHHELLVQIRHGLLHGEFELYYQPKVELVTRRLVGAEALIRWNHPTRGVLSPAAFLRIIENTEMEVELGDWVIATAIDQQRRWREQGLFIELSINVSAYHLQSLHFPEKLKAQSDMCCPGNCATTLQIEVLETAALEDVAGVSAIISECKAFGMAFALDDFGTGYSSMSYLSKFDVDVLKIDQSFIRDMLEDKGDHAIVQGIIALAKAFEMGIVAEGVETEAQYKALLQMGCEVGQGYGIARPMRADALMEWSKQA